MENLKINDIVIFHCDEYRDGNIQQFDGHVQSVLEDGVDVLYLSGYRSRNDHIKFENIIAKVDLSKPIVRLKTAPFRGHFKVFNDGDQQ